MSKRQAAITAIASRLWRAGLLLRACSEGVPGRLAKPLALALAAVLWIGAPAISYAQTTINKTVAAGSDDAEEAGADATGSHSPGDVDLDSSDIELVGDYDTSAGYSGGTQKVGLRFTTLAIPAGATITNAFLTFRAVSPDSPMTNSGATNLTINGQLIANAPTFTTTNSNISSRTPTTASVPWTPGSWSTGSNYNSPGIAAVIQEIVSQGGWASGNAIVIIVSGTGHRAAASYDSSAANAAKIAVTYMVGDTIAGTVFEDVNYGGGAGRTLAAASGTVRSNARVELFNNSGNYITFTTTNGSGNYAFAGLSTGNYTVRVVSSTVTSSRTGYVAGLLPVMTYRTDASSGTAVAVTNYVGGHDPATADAGNAAGGWTLNTATGAFSGSGSGKAHAFAQATIGGSNVTAVDFGWNFDTIAHNNGSGQGSLRQVISNANTLGGDGALAQSGRPAGIENGLFMISNGTAAAGLRGANNYFSGGVATIAPALTLPPISRPLVLDAQVQPGWVGAPIVELNGAGAGVAQGLRLIGSSGGSTLRGFVINRYSEAGIEINGANNQIIQGSWIGLDASGLAASANGVYGIYGTNSSGHLIGGTTLAARNVISGNAQQGIFFNNVDASTIAGNYIGTDFNGAADVNGAVANTFQTGVFVTNGSSGNVIGGTSPSAHNVISGNNHYGVEIVGATSQNNALQGNHIGTTANGLAPLGNTNGGVSAWGAGAGNTVGGGAAGAGNVISSNPGNGILVGNGSTAVIIQGNYVGVGADGITALGNVTGIRVEGGSTTIRIGTDANGSNDAAERNLVSGNSLGIYVSDGTGVSILRNSITSNTNLGIDLGVTGVTANNGSKNAGLPNFDMDFPVFTTASVTGTSLAVAGYVGSAPGQATFGIARVEIFKSDNDASGNGEGQLWLDFLTTDASGNFSGIVTVAGLAAGDRITATATDGGGNTSEFGDNHVVTQPTIVKRAYKLDGTPVPDGATLPLGVAFRFLLYINNLGGALTDVSLADALEPAFSYQAGSILYDNSLAVCAAETCTPAEETLIYAAATAGAAGTDTVDGDPVNYTPAVIRAGNQVAANAQLDLAAARVWALVFTARMQ